MRVSAASSVRRESTARARRFLVRSAAQSDQCDCERLKHSGDGKNPLKCKAGLGKRASVLRHASHRAAGDSASPAAIRVPLRSEVRDSLLPKHRS